MAMLGCYSFPAHVGVHHPDHGLGIDIPTVLDALRDAVGPVAYARGCDVTDADAATASPRPSTPPAPPTSCVVAVGDRAGLFGRGTSGEGCDATDLRLPGRPGGPGPRRRWRPGRRSSWCC